MSKNELYVLRANLLGGMDAYVREHLDDEEYFMEWLEMGVPDDADENTLALLEWICGPQGQALVEMTGYTGYVER